jgi:hypothetical protein
MGQNTEKGHLTRTTDDVLDDITGSKSDIFVNSDSYVSNYRASATESTCRHHLFHKPNFPHCCLLTCVNNGSKYFISIISDSDSGSFNEAVENEAPVHLLPPHNHETEPGQHGLKLIQSGPM